MQAEEKEGLVPEQSLPVTLGLDGWGVVGVRQRELAQLCSDCTPSP